MLKPVRGARVRPLFKFMKHLDLFSGIGGFALAAKWAGWETVAFCEKEKYAKRVLGRHWPNVPVIDDIRNINEKIGCDIITGGFPCQPFSVAGKQKSTADDRHLWPEMLRVISLERPTWIVAENVPGIVGLALDQVLADLESAGYSSRALIIPACAVDAPHRRDRVWVIARDIPDSSSLGSQRLNSAASDEKSSGERLRAESSGICIGESNGAINEQESLENSASTRCEARSELQLKDGATGNAYHSSERSDSGQWPAEPSICRVANGVPNRVDRLRGLGNAIVPQVAYQLFKFINEQNDNSNKR